jgi:hypothetical protein
LFSLKKKERKKKLEDTKGVIGHCVVFLFCLSLSCVLCTQCCQFLRIVHFWLPLRFSLTRYTESLKSSIANPTQHQGECMCSGRVRSSCSLVSHLKKINVRENRRGNHRYDFRIKTMFRSYFPLVVCRRAHVFFLIHYLCLFAHSVDCRSLMITRTIDPLLNSYAPFQPTPWIVFKWSNRYIHNNKRIAWILEDRLSSLS